MMRPLIYLLAASLLAPLPVQAQSRPCQDSASAEQWVFVLNGAPRDGASWKTNPEEIHLLELDNGFPLGVEIKPAPRDIYLRGTKDGSYSPELVEISLYDMAGDSPRPLTTTYGGANSIQAYSANGGADRVVETGEVGVKFFLQKTPCVSLATMAHPVQ